MRMDDYPPESEFNERTAPNEEEVQELRKDIVAALASVCAVPDCIRVARVQCDVCNAIQVMEPYDGSDGFSVGERVKVTVEKLAEGSDTK